MEMFLFGTLLFLGSLWWEWDGEWWAYDFDAGVWIHCIADQRALMLGCQPNVWPDDGPQNWLVRLVSVISCIG